MCIAYACYINGYFQKYFSQFYHTKNRFISARKLFIFAITIVYPARFYRVCCSTLALVLCVSRMLFTKNHTLSDTHERDESNVICSGMRLRIWSLVFQTPQNLYGHRRKNALTSHFLSSLPFLRFWITSSSSYSHRRITNPSSHLIFIPFGTNLHKVYFCYMYGFKKTKIKIKLVIHSLL